MLIYPTDAEKDALCAYALRMFGATPPMVVTLTPPIDAAIVVVPFDLDAFKAYVDLRFGATRTAFASAVVTRAIWCSPQPGSARGPRGSVVGGGEAAPAEETVDTVAPSKTDPDPIHRVALARTRALCATWPAADEKVALQIEDAAGWSATASASLLDAAAPPPGLSSEDAAKMLDGKPLAGPGSLWAVTSTAGLSVVMTAPTPTIWHASQGAFQAAVAARKGIVDATLIHARSLVAWCVGGDVGAYFEAHPGFAHVLHRPLADMGGAAAKASAIFL